MPVVVTSYTQGSNSTPSSARISSVSSCCICISLVDVAPGRRVAGRMLAASELRRRVPLVAGAGEQPLGVARPPGSLLLGGLAQPGLGIRPGLGSREVPCPGLARRVDDRLDVPGRRDDHL